MAKIIQIRFCAYCDTPLDELENKSRRPARFCSPIHRSLYHNKMKSLERVTEKVFGYIAQLGDMMNNENGAEFGNVAAVSLIAIEREIKRRIPTINYSCASCGQLKFVEPMKDDKCFFCGSVNSFKRNLLFPSSE